MASDLIMAITLQSFMLFPQLPIEIQLMIWTYACFLPRVLVLRYCPDIRKGICGLHPTSLIAPAILHVCQQSRKIGLKIYRIENLNYLNNFYINNAADILYLRGHENWDLMLPRTRMNFSSIRMVAVELRCFLRSAGKLHLPMVTRFLPLFQNLEKFIVIVNAPRENMKRCVTSLRPALQIEMRWREDMGVIQMERFFEVVRRIELRRGNRVDQQGLAVEGQVFRKSPEVKYEEVEEERDWRVRRRGIEAALRSEKDPMHRRAGWWL